MVGDAKEIVFDGFDGMLVKACLGQVVHDDGGALDGAFQIFNAGPSEIRRGELGFLPNHHLEQRLQKAGLSGFALPIDKSEYGVRKKVLIVADSHIPHAGHKRRAEEPVGKLKIAPLHAGYIAMELFVAGHVIEEKLHISGNIFLGRIQIQICSIQSDDSLIRKYLQLRVFAL